MIPFGNKTVTLFHVTPEGVTRHVLQNCSWRGNRTQSVYDGVVQFADALTCRYSSELQRGQTGDLYVLGDVADMANSTMDFAAVLEAHPGESFLCESFADNATGTLLSHYCAKGNA
jgi:hypothetical protein